MENKNGMDDDKAVLPVLLCILFFTVSTLSWLFTGTIYRYAESSESLYVNNVINSVLSLFIIFIYLSKKNAELARELNVFSSLFIIYNTVPMLIQMENIALLIMCLLTAVFSAILFVRSIGKGGSNVTVRYSVAERLIYGGILVLFSLIFIGRGIVTVTGYMKQSVAVSELSVGIADIAVCLVWFGAAGALIFNNHLGVRNIFPVFLQASLLFITLIAYLFVDPIIRSETVVFGDVIFITVMSLFFIIPTILIGRRRKPIGST